MPFGYLLAIMKQRNGVRDLSESSSYADLVAAPRETLIEATLRHATAAIPFYQEWFASRPAPKSLLDLPIIDAQDVDADFRRFCDQSAWPNGWLTTGGTTGGHTLIPRCAAEAEFVRARRASLQRSRAQDVGERAGGSPGLTLMMVDNNHGVIEGNLGGEERLALPLVDRRHAEVIAAAIIDGFRWNGVVRPVRTIVGSVSKVKTLSAFLIVQGTPPSKAGVSVIITHAWHLSAVAHRALAATWGCPVLSSYGLTEANQEIAIRCPACSAYHFTEAIDVEFLHPLTRGPWSDGDAELCISTLFPYAQTSPRLRYATNDIVRPLGPCRATGAPAFEYLGRKRHVCLDASVSAPRILLAARGIVDALDSLDWPARFDPYGDRVMLGVRGPGRPDLPAGFPSMSLRFDQTQRHVQVTVEARRSATDADLRELRRRIILAHRSVRPELEATLAAGNVSLACEAVPAGTFAANGQLADRV
jgi:phenylacetate-coenzyme A ligase PaaK-like adenylate-forming protein